MRFIKKEPKKRRHVREDVILFTLGPHRFAIGAKAVEKIESFDRLREVRLATGSPALSKVKHVMEHDAKTYFIVDGSGHLQMLPSRVNRVLLLRKTQIGLAVDAIERMAEITALHPLPKAFRGEERRWFRGIAFVQDAVLPVLNADALLSDDELVMAQSALAKAARASGPLTGAATA